MSYHRWNPSRPGWCPSVALIRGRSIDGSVLLVVVVVDRAACCVRIREEEEEEDGGDGEDGDRDKGSEVDESVVRD